jgi:CubicO group peptidase (beta-lactamase class C family)
MCNTLMMRDLVDRLKALGPIIAEICQISGTPGASIGVLRNGEVVYTHNCGFRDVGARIPPDEHTIYPICFREQII